MAMVDADEYWDGGWIRMKEEGESFEAWISARSAPWRPDGVAQLPHDRTSSSEIRLRYLDTE